MSLDKIYKQLFSTVELKSEVVSLSIIDDFQKERGDILKKSNISNDIAKLIALQDYAQSSLNRLLDRQKIALKQLTDLGLTDIANDLKKYMGFNEENMKKAEKTISVLQSLK